MTSNSHFKEEKKKKPGKTTDKFQIAEIIHFSEPYANNFDDTELANHLV